MTTRPQLRVLFFDVFGTTVAQRTPVADELWRAAKQALESETLSIDSEVRSKAMKMTYEQWFELGGEWDRDVDTFASDSKTQHNHVDWKLVDAYRLDSLYKLLATLGLINHGKDASTSKFCPEKGSLWDHSQLKELCLIWRRLPPWPDTCRGLGLLNTRFDTVTLSNTYRDLMENLVAHSSMPFKYVYTADMFDSYKPNPKVYLGAAEKMGVKPEECGLVAAHLNDLKGAKACGFYTVYVERPLEEKSPELHVENIPDMRIKDGESGFITLAKRLGIQVD